MDHRKLQLKYVDPVTKQTKSIMFVAQAQSQVWIALKLLFKYSVQEQVTSENGEVVIFLDEHEEVLPLLKAAFFDQEVEEDLQALLLEDPETRNARLWEMFLNPTDEWIESQTTRIALQAMWYIRHSSGLECGPYRGFIHAEAKTIASEVGSNIFVCDCGHCANCVIRSFLQYGKVKEISPIAV